MKVWLTSILFASVTAHASLVQLSSVYQDDSKADRLLRVNGSGLLFTHAGRQFVFTASHVSGGDQLKIMLDQTEGHIVGRAVSAASDVELIEVSGFDPAKIDASSDGTYIRYRLGGERQRWIDAYNFVPLLPFVNDPNLDTDNVYSRSRATVLGLDYFATLLHGDTLIQPGTSGAPLVTVIPDMATWRAPTLPYDLREGFDGLKAGETVVRGVAIRRERFFSHASFIPVRAVFSLLTEYLQGKPPQPLVRWHAEGPLLFRVQTDDLLRETTSFAAATAGGTVVDSGNGVSMSGGDLESLAEDSPSDFLSKVSAFPTFESRPQMYWMLAMRHPKTKALISLWAWFDMDLYESIRQFVFATRPEKEEIDLVSQLYPRFNKRRDFEIPGDQYLRVDRNGVFARLAVTGGDQLEFQINRAGALCANGGACGAGFSPVIEVLSKIGQTYLVDLHQLFFIDGGRAMTAAMRDPASTKLSPEDRRALVFDALQGEMGLPRITYRKKRVDISVPMTLEQGLQREIQWKAN